MRQELSTCHALLHMSAVVLCQRADVRWCLRDAQIHSPSLHFFCTMDAHGYDYL